MFIQTEDTPNPETIKFLPGQSVTGTGMADFKSIDETGPSILARNLFRINGVGGVMLGPDFVSVSKTGDAEWNDAFKTQIMAVMMDHFTSGLPALEKEMPKRAESDNEIVKQINAVLDDYVTPYVSQHGGHIEFYDYDDDSGVVYLSMQGACAGCPSSTATLKMGIENMLQQYIPEVAAVEAV